MFANHHIYIYKIYFINSFILCLREYECLGAYTTLHYFPSRNRTETARDSCYAESYKVFDLLVSLIMLFLRNFTRTMYN